ncbi:MAG: hypothetical protein RLY31_129 [Bacteroidota bacterium]
MRTILTFLLSLLYIVVTAQSVDGLIPRDLYFLEKDKRQVTLSADGAHVLYQRTGRAQDSILYYTPVRLPHVVKQRRFDGILLDWMPTGNGGLVIALRQGGESHLFTAGLTSTPPRKLRVPPFEEVRFLHRSPRFPNKVVVDLQTKDSLRSGIYILDLMSSSLKRLGRMDGFRAVYFDENFTWLAGIREDRANHPMLVRRDEGEWREVMALPPGEGAAGVVSVRRDGSALYCVASGDRDKAALWELDLRTGALRMLAEDEQADLLSEGAFIDGAGAPLAVSVAWSGGRQSLVDTAAAGLLAALREEIGADLRFVGADDRDSVWLVKAFAGGPATYFSYDRGSGKATRLFSERPALDAYDAPVRTLQTFTRRDGARVPAYLYVPAGMAKADGTPKAPLPTMLYVHDPAVGGYGHWDDWTTTRHLQLLANRGYVVLDLAVRGSAGLGKAFAAAADGQWGGARHFDLVDAAIWAVRAGFSSRKRIGLLGWYSGGQAAAFAMGAAPDIFSCGIALQPLCDLSAFGPDSLSATHPWARALQAIDGGAEAWTAQSPQTYVKDVIGPVLLAAGETDTIVPAEQTDRFATALHTAGKSVIQLHYPEEPGYFRQPGSWVSFWAVAEHFLHTHLSGRRQPRDADVELGDMEIRQGAEYVESID